METSPYPVMAVELLRVLVAVRPSENKSVRIVAAKELFCGQTRPINEFHSALAAATARNWLSYSDDLLSLSVTDLGYAIAASSEPPRRAFG
jgi:hypothetical protein